MSGWAFRRRVHEDINATDELEVLTAELPVTPTGPMMLERWQLLHVKPESQCECSWFYQGWWGLTGLQPTVQTPRLSLWILTGESSDCEMQREKASRTGW